jgi:hypothetical protein
MGATHNIFDEALPPRRGKVFALTVDSTARAYDLLAVDLAGFTPSNSQREQSHVVLYMQAETNDVYFYFAEGEAGAVVTTDVDDISDTAAIAAGGALTPANTYAGVLKAGNGPLPVRIDRSVDRFLVVKAASTSGVLRFWPASSPG